MSGIWQKAESVDIAIISLASIAIVDMIVLHDVTTAQAAIAAITTSLGVYRWLSRGKKGTAESDG